MSGSCSTNVREEKCINIIVADPEGKDCLECRSIGKRSKVKLSLCLTN
jgi:hypothetical protein